MALVNYIKNNIPETTIGFLTEDSSFRDYLINIIPVMFNGIKVIEYQDKGQNSFKILITDTQNETLIKTLNRKFSILTYKNKTIIFIPKNEDQEIEIKVTEEDILDLLEGEIFYNIFMGFEKKKELREVPLEEKVKETEYKKATFIEFDNPSDEYIYFPKISPFTKIVVSDYLFTDVSLYSSADEKHSIETANLLLNYYSKQQLKGLSLIEASACIGGNTWGFNTLIDNVTAIEIDENNYTSLVHNMNTIRSTIEPIKDNFIKVKDTGKWDIVFYDPPWGGVNYKNEPQVGYSYNGKFYDLNTLASKSFYPYPPELLMFRIPIKSEININEYKYRDEVIFKDKYPIYKIIIFSDIKPLRNIEKEVFVKRINYKALKTHVIPINEVEDITTVMKNLNIEDSFEKLYSVPERPSEFKNSNEEGNTSELVGWRPFKPYLKKEDVPLFKGGHWGQRKLLLTEILFFTLHGKPNTTVIYAGAAPSDHMLFLSKMFPTYHFVLVDPERWNKDFGKIHNQLSYNNFPEYPVKGLVDVKIDGKYVGPYTIRNKNIDGSFIVIGKDGKTEKVFVTDIQPHGKVNFVQPTYYKINDSIDVYHGYFTDELAVKLGKEYANTNVLFVSDIRPTNIEGVSSTLEERDDIVIKNMEMQKNWYLLINKERRNIGKEGVWAMFKFKATFGIPKTTYLKGDLYYQPWAPLKSPELRLITNSEETRDYSNDWLEQHLTWFNEVRRNTLKEPRDKRVNGVFDTQYEYDIMKMYVDKFSPMDKDIYNWMRKISAELGDRDKNKQGLLQFQEGYETDEWRKNKWIESLLTKMQKYTPGTTGGTSMSPFNPIIIPKKMNFQGKNFNLIDDGDLFGGSKIRILPKIVKDIKEEEIVYAGPDSGMAQIAISLIGLLNNKKVTMFVNTYKDIDPKPYLVDFGINYLQTNYKFSFNPKGRTLKETHEAAEKYIKENPKNRYLFSFGLKDEKTVSLFEDILKEALVNVKAPERLWLVVGSGMILKVLQNIWPSTQYMCVQVGKTVWPDQLRDGKDKLYVAPEFFSTTATLQPPYDTIPWYDAKLWQFFIKDGKDGDYIWNVASLPTVESLQDILSKS